MGGGGHRLPGGVDRVTRPHGRLDLRRLGLPDRRRRQSEPDDSGDRDAHGATRPGARGMNVGDFLIQRLSDWGVRRIYGYPGDGINGIMGALARAEERMEFVQVRHEEMAAFMACGAREVHRRGRRLPGDVRPGRDPSPERPLRREARPPARGRDRRPAGACPPSAAATSRRSISSRCSRTSRASTARWSRRPSSCDTWSTARCGSRSPSAR